MQLKCKFDNLQPDLEMWLNTNLMFRYLSINIYAFCA
jgi:hypothetical protein